MQLLAGTDVGTGVKGHVGVCGWDSPVQSHGMGGVRGRAEGHTGTHTHTQRNVHANVAPTLQRPTPLKVPDTFLHWRSPSHRRKQPDANL